MTLTANSTAAARLMAAIQNEPLPLRIDEHGVIRVSGTGVTLDTIIETFKQGSTPDEIAEGFSTVPRADIYTVIGYYLRHWYAVEAYLLEQNIEAEQIRQKIEAISPSTGLKQRLRERRRTIPLKP